MARRKDEHDHESLPGQAQDLWQLVVGYAKQETLDPIKGLGRFIGFGLASALLSSVGVVLLLLGGLRFLQTETGAAFHGRKTFLPYMIVLVVGGAVTLGALRARGRGDARGRPAR